MNIVLGPYHPHLEDAFYERHLQGLAGREAVVDLTNGNVPQDLSQSI